MKYSYCTKWSPVRKEPWEVIDAETACKNHNSGSAYSVLVEYDGVLTHVIDISKNHIYVRFLNENKSAYLCYTFLIQKRNKLFLKNASYIEYDEVLDEETELLLFNFFEDGRLYIEKIDRKSGKGYEFESTSDLKENWETFPEFGDYSNLLTETREWIIGD